MVGSAIYNDTFFMRMNFTVAKKESRHERGIPMYVVTIKPAGSKLPIILRGQVTLRPMRTRRKNFSIKPPAYKTSFHLLSQASITQN